MRTDIMTISAKELYDVFDDEDNDDLVWPICLVGSEGNLSVVEEPPREDVPGEFTVVTEHGTLYLHAEQNIRVCQGLKPGENEAPPIDDSYDDDYDEDGNPIINDSAVVS